MTRMLPRRLRAATAALCLALAATATAGPAAARPLTIEDRLHAAVIGDARIDPTERWAVIEHGRPYAAASRFDFDLAQGIFNTELRLLDLHRPGPAEPLFPAEPGAGYAAGPFSPDGRRLAVFRLTHDSWTLGLADPAGRTVRWFDVTPDFSWQGRSVAWTSPTELVVITPPPGELPVFLRRQRSWRELPALWESTARGGANPGVWSSGAALQGAPDRPPGVLLRIDTATGQVRPLARGRFIDLEAAPGGRTLALLETGEDIRLKPDQSVRDEYGNTTQRRRLRLYHMVTGRLSTPCPGCDALEGLLAWSPRGDALMAYARQDGEPWPAGRLYRLPADGGRPRAYPGVGPALIGSPPIIFATWLGDAPAVYGRADAAAGRDDWLRLAEAGPKVLTGQLPPPSPQGVVAAGDGLLAVAGGRAWRLGSGAPKTVAPGEVEVLPLWSRSLNSRGGLSIAGRMALPVRRRAPSGDVLLDLADPARRQTPLPAEADLFAYAPRRGGALVRTLDGGGRQRLQWVSPGRPAVLVMQVNDHLLDVDPPELRVVRHPGPDGRPATSWLLLPKRSAGPPPPPLVVVPYLGWSMAQPPAIRLTGGYQDYFDPLFLAGHGYAVLCPSLPYPPGEDPTAGLGERVMTIVRAAAVQPDLAGAFDPERLGIVGQSFGGYTTLAIISQVDDFDAAVARNGPSSLITKWGEFSPGGRNIPGIDISSAWSSGWVETTQGKMKAPPWQVADRYVRASPVMQADRIHTPLMLVQGEFDSMHPAEAERMFSALFRQDKTARLVEYRGEGHIFGSPGVYRDYYARTFDWLDHHFRPGPPGPPSGTPRPR
jgi:dipeptidyl aminopeptidase/acylaminoacyl peptidase